MQSVGTRLRDARIKKGYTLEEINARTRISLKNLNAIEADDLSKISSPFTYRSFVKQFADMVGLDHDALSPDAQAASSTMPEPLVPGQEEEVIVRPHQLQQARPKRNLAWAYRTASIAAIAGVISGYLIWRNGGIQAAKLPASFLPASSREIIPANLELVQPPARTEQAVALPVSTQAAVSKVEPEAVPQAEEPPPPPGTEQLLPPKATPAIRKAQVGAVSQPSSLPVGPGSAQLTPPEIDSAAIHIELSAIEATWLSIVADGKTTYTGVLEAMETKTLDGKETARIRTANAGGVNIIFNGRALGTLGRRGQSRTFVFTKGGYEVVQGAANAEVSRLNPSGE
jgi:cytoskeleton protein RodZ